jgi:hypothetical protein
VNAFVCDCGIEKASVLCGCVFIHTRVFVCDSSPQANLKPKTRMAVFMAESKEMLKGARQLAMKHKIEERRNTQVSQFYTGEWGCLSVCVWWCDVCAYMYMYVYIHFNCTAHFTYTRTRTLTLSRTHTLTQPRPKTWPPSFQCSRCCGIPPSQLSAC